MRVTFLSSKHPKEVSIYKNQKEPNHLTYKLSTTENAYNETLETIKKSFPQYIRELEGIADGAQVEFHKVNIIIILNSTNKKLIQIASN